MSWKALRSPEERICRLEAGRDATSDTSAYFPALVYYWCTSMPRKNVARQEVEGCKEEACRKDTIIMSLTQRIPELEASPEPREDHVATSESTDKVTLPRSSRSLHSAARGSTGSSLLEAL